VASLASSLVSCFAFGLTGSTQAHTLTVFSCAFGRVPGSCWSVAVKGFSLVTLRMFGWHPCLVHQMGCYQWAFGSPGWEVSWLWVPGTFILQARKKALSLLQDQSSLFGTKNNVVLGVVLCTWLGFLYLNNYFIPVVILQIYVLRTPWSLVWGKNKSRCGFQEGNCSRYWCLFGLPKLIVDMPNIAGNNVTLKEYCWESVMALIPRRVS